MYFMASQGVHCLEYFVASQDLLSLCYLFVNSHCLSRHLPYNVFAQMQVWMSRVECTCTNKGINVMQERLHTQADKAEVKTIMSKEI